MLWKSQRSDSCHRPINRWIHTVSFNLILISFCSRVSKYKGCWSPRLLAGSLGQHIKVFLDSAFHWNNSVLISQQLLPGCFQGQLLLAPWSWSTRKSLSGGQANETISISGRNTAMRAQTTGRREACITHGLIATHSAPKHFNDIVSFGPHKGRLREKLVLSPLYDEENEASIHAC